MRESREEEIQTEEGGLNTQTTDPAQKKTTKGSKKSRKGGNNEEEIQGFYKKMRNESRYLSDTGFRKYFDRQVFENYGNANVHDHNDGFVYGNYLKTHNINPHTQQNLPQTEETFYHALKSASPDKFQHLKGHLERHGEDGTREATEGERGVLEAGKMVEDNMRHSRMAEKYSRLRLGKSEDKWQVQSAVQRSGYVQAQQVHR